MTPRIERDVRVTIRCVVEDLGLELPPIDQPIASIEDPMMDEARRVAPDSPTGQKRILAIRHPLVYRVRISRRRGATWLDEEQDILWLLAVEDREDDSDDDAFAYFARLHESGRLMPSGDDRMRIAFEEGAQLLGRIRAELGSLLGDVRRAEGPEVQADLAGFLPIRLHASTSQGIEELWMAVSTLDGTGEGVPARLRDMIFAVAEQLLEPAEWEARADWPTGRLEWFEVCRLAIREEEL